MFDTVPPLVNAPAAAGKPTNSATQRTAWSSISVAAAAHTARFASKQDASRSPMHADLEPGGGDEREESRPGLGDRLVKPAAGVFEHLEHAGRRFGQRRREQLLEPVVDRRLRRAGVIEAAPALGDDLGRALESLLTRDVEAKAHEGRIGISATRRSSAVTEAGMSLIGSSAGPSSGAPSTSEKSAPWQAQRIASPSIQPSPSGHSAWVHHVSKTTCRPPTRATTSARPPASISRSSPSPRSEGPRSRPRHGSHRTWRCCGARNSQPLLTVGRSRSGRSCGSLSKSRWTAIRICTREK